MHKYARSQAKMRQKLIFQLKLCGVLISGEISNVSRYQKYWVGLLCYIVSNNTLNKYL